MAVIARAVGFAALVAAAVVALLIPLVWSGEARGAATTAERTDGVVDGRDGAPSDAVARDERSEHMPYPVRHGVRVDNTRIPVDVRGRRLDAHDGDLIRASDGHVYLYGTAYGCGFRLNQPGPYCGVRVYRSRDLATWEPAGAISGTHAFDHHADDWQELCTAPRFGCFRPHVVRRPSDGRHIMWINTHVGPGTGAAGYRVLVSDDPQGPFVDSGVTPRLAVDAGDGGLEHGDMDVTVDPATGVGYVVYTAIDFARSPSHTLVVEELDLSFTTGTGRYTQVAAAGGPVESPSLFQGPVGTWHIAYSDPAAPYGVVGTSVVDAPAPLGPWSGARSLSADSCGGQPAAVVDLGGEWVFMVDRWVQSPSGLVANQTEANTYWGRLAFAPDGGVRPHECRGTWAFARPDAPTRTPPAPALPAAVAPSPP